MAVTRTILPRKGLIDPGHGTTTYEADFDFDLTLLDANVAFMSDLQQTTFDINGVFSGFTLSTSGTLTPGLSAGVLYAEGNKYAPGSPPTLAAAPPSAVNYLFYNSSTGFYYQTGAVGATSGDALIGKVTTSGGAVTSVTQATKVFGKLAITTSAPGDFTQPHLLGRAPLSPNLLMTAGGFIWWQDGTQFDGTNLYLTASDTGLTAVVILF